MSIPTPPWYQKIEAVLLSARWILFAGGAVVIGVTAFLMYEVATKDKYAVPLAGWLAYVFSP
jgi:hypothetical protein